MTNMEKVRTSIVDTARIDHVQPLSRTLGDTRNRLRQGLLAILYQLIQALENPDENPSNP